MSKRFKIITVIGARPHFIKVAALTRALTRSDHLDQIMVHSGQHYDDALSGRFFRELDLPTPKYNLAIGSQSPNQQISECIRKLDEVLADEHPDMVLVIGDTNTTAAAAITSKKRNIALGHIEAGLREFDRTIPEEINKLIIDAISDLYFAPTRTAMTNLHHQGITKGVYLTGDIGLDLLSDTGFYQNLDNFRLHFNLPENYLFMTCHRDANTTNAVHLEQIFRGVSQIDLPVVFSMHPRTKKAIETFQLHPVIGGNVRRIAPLSFWDTQQMIRGARAVLTDSGGVIKEAYFHGVPSIILDYQTEWVEIVEEGWATLAGPQSERIFNAFSHLSKPGLNRKSLGDGKAGARIIQIIEQFFHVKQ